jgi:hypothetical protein
MQESGKPEKRGAGKRKKDVTDPGHVEKHSPLIKGSPPHDVIKV